MHDSKHDEMVHVAGFYVSHHHYSLLTAGTRSLPAIACWRYKFKLACPQVLDMPTE